MRHLALALVIPILAPACVGHRAPPAYEPKGQTKCSVAMSQLRPLVVEWPSADRVDLEAQARKSIVVVRYEGCEMEVLRGCSVAGTYGYSPATRQDDRVHIRDEDSLYANIPIHAVKFEAALRSAGELTVAMSMVGRYESAQAKVSKSDLQGDCARATHAIVSLTTGAFEFYTGADEGSSAGVGVASTGAGVKAGYEHTTLNRAGRSEACDRATTHDREPPDGCGAVLRIELTPIEGATPVMPPPVIATTNPPVATAPPSCAIGTRWDGAKCVALSNSPFCPLGMEWSGTGCFVPYESGNHGRGEDGCPLGLALDKATRNCTPEGSARCPAGTRFEAGRGCMAGDAPKQAPARRPNCPAGMIGLPGGVFLETGPVAPVAPFCLDATEVTADAYKVCVDARRCTADNVTCDVESAKWATYGVAGRGRHPMNCVSREQAIAYCAVQGKRLPSEHEWEWAARGGLEARKFPWGGTDWVEGQACLSKRNTGTCEVGIFPASDSAQGVHDLQGNVSEWVSDMSAGWQYYKGVAWSSAWDNRDLAVDYENRHWPGNMPDRYPYVGFRCARSVAP